MYPHEEMVRAQSDVAYEYFRDTFTAAVSTPIDAVRLWHFDHMPPMFSAILASSRDVVLYGFDPPAATGTRRFFIGFS